MMHRLRQVAVALLFASLIVAFALWGAGDYTRLQSQRPLASVGSVEINAPQFKATYQRTLKTLSARARRRVTPQEAQAYGLPQGVLQRMIQDAAFEAEAKDLGLGLSPAGLDAAIRSNKAFQDDDGKFSQAKLEQMLAQAEFTVPDFIAEVRADLIRRQLRGQFEKGPVVPDVLLGQFNLYLNEERVIDSFTVGDAAVGALPAPSDDALRGYYNDRKSQFSFPEKRKLTIVAVTPETVKGLVTVSDEDLKAAYGAKPGSFGTPEKRKIELIPFQTKKAADEASAALASGKDFLDVAKSAGFKQSEIDMGLVSKDEFVAKSGLPEKARDAVFGVEKGKLSEPLEGPLAVGIARVLEIIPATQKTFDESKEQIRADLQATRAGEQVGKLTKAFEDDRQSGVTLTDAAKKLNLGVSEIDVERNGNGPDGKPVSLPGVPVSAVVDAAFKSDVGVENQALRAPSGGYIWFDVADITKSRQKTFDEAKADVEAGWKRDQLRDKTAEKARELVKQIESGEKIADAAKGVGAEAKASKSLKRNDKASGLSPSVISQAFSLGEGAAGSATGADGVSRTVFQVSKVTPPGPLKDDAAEALRQQMAQSITEDNVAQFAAAIKTRLGSTIDVKQVAAAAGSSADADADE